LGRVETSIVITAQPEKIWQMLAVDRFHEWNIGTQKNVKNIEYTSEIRSPEDKLKVDAIAQTTIDRSRNKNVEHNISNWRYRHCR
jgi:hypothetical protein